ncbi:preprotein translocase subunit YajC [Microbacterium sp. X-17]|uniref:preprotein translocase subunit YajC n=1 Tax=Microbacterium sp. X-17 TaxID=3144404 RepID=UPI0031F580E6
MDFGSFIGNYGLIIVMVILLIFLVWSSRRRSQRAKAEQEKKGRETVPGAEVLLQGGLYGTIIAFDANDLDKPAEVQLAPGVVIKVHSQAILRVVEPARGFVTEDDFIQSEASEEKYVDGVADGEISSISDDQRRAAAKQENETDPEKKDKPEA